MNIYNNLLNIDKFKKIQNFIMGPYMPWFFNEGVATYKKDPYFQFTFNFVEEGKIACNEKHFQLVEPILKKINFKKLNRIRANLLTKSNKIVEHGFHVDQEKGTTGILYLNNCNGYTKFKTGEKIKSKENTYVEFDSSLQHTGSSCTDEKRRVVINFNYELN
tara:strand:- start:44 stop:529 length:486 start_codon:yes stop_codon:yes gene_type:complete